MQKKVITQTYVESVDTTALVKVYHKKEEIIHYRDKYKQKYIMIDLDKMQKYQSISYATMARIAYLASFCDYNNRLMLTERTCMRKNNLSTVLNLSERAERVFKRELLDLNILRISSTGEMFLSDDLFYRGKRKCNKARINVESLRSAYLNVTQRSHKYLGIIIFLAFYINKTHNIICWNTKEVDVDLISPFTIKEICEITKYATCGGHSGRLTSIISTLMFEYKGEIQPVCFIDYISTSKGSQKMIKINPNLISTGCHF